AFKDVGISHEPNNAAKQRKQDQNWNDFTRRILTRDSRTKHPTSELRCSQWRPVFVCSTTEEPLWARINQTQFPTRQHCHYHQVVSGACVESGASLRASILGLDFAAMREPCLKHYSNAGVDWHSSLLP
ncbi:unnamed protein product, partial [Ectocarpus sp. 4 AP-2014]